MPAECLILECGGLTPLLPGLRGPVIGVDGCCAVAKEKAASSRRTPNSVRVGTSNEKDLAFNGGRGRPDRAVSLRGPAWR